MVGVCYGGGNGKNDAAEGGSCYTSAMQLLRDATGAIALGRKPPTRQSRTVFHGSGALWACLMAGLLLCGPAPCPAQVMVQIGQNFTGSTYGTHSQALPPDPNGA